MAAPMQKRKVWWKSWAVAVIALVVVGSGIVPFLLPDTTPKPEKVPQSAEPEAEIYLQPVDGHGITPPQSDQHNPKRPPPK